MKVEVLGTGDFFSFIRYNSSFIVNQDDFCLAIDCPHPYLKILFENSTSTLKNINDVVINKNELVGRIIKGVDPGIANVASWTELLIDETLEINKDDLKNTDKTVTNGDYQSSWFKGPHRVLENKWRSEHNINELFELLSQTSLRTSRKEQILEYLKILFTDNNYEKMKEYKYDPRRQKWRYKRLLGKRSYIDKFTNDMAFGIPLKKYGRQRGGYKIHKDYRKEVPAIIIFGAANYKTSMKNYSAVPKKAILRVLAQKTSVLLINEHNTTKKCFKCGNNVQEVTETHAKQLGDRKFNKWSKTNLRNVRYCENISCKHEDNGKFFIGRDVNASNNILINGFKHISGDHQGYKVALINVYLKINQRFIFK